MSAGPCEGGWDEVDGEEVENWRLDGLVHG